MALEQHLLLSQSLANVRLSREERIRHFSFVKYFCIFEGDDNNVVSFTYSGKIWPEWGGKKKKKQIGKIDIEGAVIAVVFMHGRNFLSVSLITRKFWIMQEKLQLWEHCLSLDWIQSFLKSCYGQCRPISNTVKAHSVPSILKKIALFQGADSILGKYWQTNAIRTLLLFL